MVAFTTRTLTTGGGGGGGAAAGMHEATKRKSKLRILEACLTERE
jgi:hypothetical protein